MMLEDRRYVYYLHLDGELEYIGIEDYIMKFWQSHWAEDHYILMELKLVPCD